MTRMKLLVPLLLLPCLAGAEDRGEVTFKKACAQCHVARTSAKEAKAAKGLARESRRVPSLDTLVTQRTPEQLSTWIDAPHKVRPQTGCDTRRLQPGEKDAIMGYLATLSQPPALPRQDMLRQQLEKDLAAYRAQQKKSDPKTDHLPRLTPGEK
jgi:cytochrome c2